MIKFFRHIRQRLVNENRFSKYMLYAIGEIVLVVIGILIALQINNWNENRKDAKKEKIALNQLKKDLDQTFEDLEEIKEFFRTRAESAQIVLHSYWTRQYLKDTLLYHFGRVGSNRKYSPIMSTAQSLINSGAIELISSEELKTAIIKYTETVNDLINDISRYEETYYRPANSSKHFSYFNLIGTYNEQELKHNRRDRALMPYPKDFKSPPFPEDLEEIYANKEIYLNYEYFLIAHRNTNSRYKDMQDATGELLALLKDHGYD